MPEMFHGDSPKISVLKWLMVGKIIESTGKFALLEHLIITFPKK